MSIKDILPWERGLCLCRFFENVGDRLLTLMRNQCDMYGDGMYPLEILSEQYLAKLQ